MSVVVWDGKTLAADRQGTNGDMRLTEPKMAVQVSEFGDVVCAWTGISAYGKQLAQWYYNGAHKDDWPEFQKDKDNWCRLIVANSDGCIFYEVTPYPLVVHDPYMAWGAGRDFAMGALSMGADARKAVEVASKFSTVCGGGVDAYDLGARAGPQYPPASPRNK